MKRPPVTEAQQRDFATRGWVVLPPTPERLSWAQEARRHALGRLPDVPPDQWRHGRTWCVGLDLLPNDRDGALPSTTGTAVPLASDAASLLDDPILSGAGMHSGQVSVVRPGYPQKNTTDSDGAWRYRVNRAAAHVDGLRAEGPARRRFIRELHGYILGRPLNHASAGAGSLVVWDGSHRHMGAALQSALKNVPRDAWDDADITDPYADARRTVFATCRRVDLSPEPGSEILLHRHMLHGIAPWQDGADAAPEGRMVAYFRPIAFARVADWLGTG